MSKRLARRITGILVFLWIVAYGPVQAFALPFRVLQPMGRNGRGVPLFAVWYFFGPIFLVLGSILLFIAGAILMTFFSWAFDLDSGQKQTREQRIEELEREVGIGETP